MSAQEYGYWEAEYIRHPWGDYAVELGAGVIASTIANVNRGKDSKPYRISDFMPLQQHTEHGEEMETDPREWFKQLDKNG